MEKIGRIYFSLWHRNALAADLLQGKIENETCAAVHLLPAADASIALISSVRSSSGYHGLLHTRSAAQLNPLFQIFQILQILK